MSLTVKEWDAIADRLETKVFSKHGEEEQTFLLALYGGLLQYMKDEGITIDEALVICEEKVTGEKKVTVKKKGLSKKS